MQPLPYHAGLAAHLLRRLQSITAFSACSCPLHLSMSGEPLTQKQSSQFLPAAPGIRQCATRRTLAPRRPSRRARLPPGSACGRRSTPAFPALIGRCWTLRGHTVPPLVLVKSPPGCQTLEPEALHGPIGLGLQAVELAPYHAGLAAQRFQRLLSVL